MSLPEALERAAEALPGQADQIRPANGDPAQLLSTLDEAGSRAVLVWLLGHEAEAGEELLQAWCEDVRGIERVQSVDVKALPKAGKKLLRRALHRMRTSGVDVASAAQTREPVVARLSGVSDEIEGAYMTPVDPRGSVLIFLVEANPGGGARLFQILLDERRGVVEFDVYTTGRSRTRSFLRKLTDSTPSGASGAVAVESSIARGIIARMAAGHPKDRPFPRSFSEWRRKLEAGASKTTPEEGASQLVGGAAGADAVERVVQRVKDSKLGPWPPDASRIGEVSAALSSALDDVLTKQGEARDEALAAALDEAAAALFAGEHAAQTAMRFSLSAYVHALAGQEDEARDELAAAAAFVSEAPGVNPIALAMTEIFTASVLKRAEPPDPAEEPSTETVES